MEPSGGSAGQLLVSSALPVVEMCLIGGIGALMVHKVRPCHGTTPL